MNRRAFLISSIGLAASGRLIAAPASAPRFLLVFLRGGYDAANVLVPVSSRFYYEVRPNIAVAREAVLPIDADWGLHPALGQSLYPLYQRRELALIPFAGTEDTSRSHFETQDSIELGQPLGARSYASGFLNRLAVELGPCGAISFTTQVPVAFRGEAQVANVALNTVGRTAVDARQSALIAEMYKGTTLDAQVSEGFAARDTVMRDLGDEMVAASRNAVAPRAFEAQAQRIARLMRGDYRLGFVDVGGWDTHVGEGGANGLLATRLEELGRGLGAFSQSMGDAWRDTVVVVISEFGRTFRENGNRGTDHGHGTAYWVMGGAVHGGRIAGEQARVARESLFQDRDYPVLNEYRSVLGGIFSRMYGLEATQLARIFPQAKTKDLALV
ncbi:MAG TPA: DUF1501 domain-containing protein [Burkholderiales bacterium]|nr:DUF1501 domain-containing protein [Burkholderiales bacterium]